MATIPNITIYGNAGDDKLSGLTTDEALKVYSGAAANNSPQGDAIVSTGTGSDATTTDKGVASESGGSSNIPPMARIPPGQIAGSAVAKSNQNVAHVCNIPSSIQVQIFKAGAFGGKIIAAIRKAIKAIQKFFGINPSSNGLVSYMKKVAAWIKKFTDWLKEINDYVQKLLTYIAIVKEVIAWILSLPSFLMNYFKDCLKQAYAILKAGYNSAIAIDENSPLDTDTSQMMQQYEDLQKEFDKMKAEWNNLNNAVNETAASINQLMQAATSDLASGKITQDQYQKLMDQYNSDYYSKVGGVNKNSSDNYETKA